MQRFIDTETDTKTDTQTDTQIDTDTDTDRQTDKYQMFWLREESRDPVQISSRMALSFFEFF